MKTIIYIISFFALLTIVISCKDKQKNEEFKGNNKEVLKNWAENIIIPSYENYQTNINKLVSSAKEYKNNTNEQNFNKLKNSWLDAYKAYQKILIFDFSIAEDTHLAGMTNTYPTKIEDIETNIGLIAQNKTDEINLESSFIVKRHTYQGFPALDYLLFEGSHTIEYYQTDRGKHASTYIVMLTETLQKNINTVVDFWKKNKDNYINDTDNSVTGAYASTINAFIRTYEKDIRAAKVGYAAGAIKAQNNKPAPEIIEAYHNASIDKELLEISLKSSQNFFNGKHFSSNKNGKSLKSILKKLGRDDLVKDINQQYANIYSTIKSMPNSLKETAVSDNEAMRVLYDAIQVNVAYYKTEMMAALKVQVGYQDTDGD